MTTQALSLSLWPRLKRLDRAWLATALVLAALAVLDRAQVLPSLRFAADAYLGTVVYLALAVGMAAYAKATGADALIARAFTGHIALMIGLAALAGGLSPFCSCGVIPLIAALLAMGVPLPAVMAFWLSSPIMDPSMFMLTAGTLGLPFAVAKTAAAIGLGLFGGFGTLALQRAGLLTDPLRPGVGNGGCAARSVRDPKPVFWPFWRDADRRRAFGKEMLASGLFLTKWLVLAFLLESLMVTYVPADLVARLTGGEGVLPVVTAALVGVPAYLNGYAALPLAAGLMDQGMAPSVAMAFLVAGGVSSLPAAIAVWALVRKPVFGAYMGFALAGAVLAGLIFGLVAG
ncbi:MAG: permease [Rhodobacterales bacterium]|nr:permease [Rhodobacterales bacterium]